MAKGIRVGVGGVKTSKKVWVGVGGVARKVRKVFAGIGGVVKLLFSSGISITEAPLNVDLSRIGAAGAGNYAVFAGGRPDYFSTSVRDTVYAYNQSLVRSTPAVLGRGRMQVSGLSFSGCAFFPYGSTSAPVSNIDAYNASLVRVLSTESVGSRYYMAATCNSSHAILAGGYQSSKTNPTNQVEAFNTSFTRLSPKSMSYRQYGQAATTINEDMLIAGGKDKNGDGFDGVLRFNSSLVISTLSPLSVARGSLGACVVGDYALFIGGDFTGNNQSVDAYSKSFVRTTLTPLTYGRSEAQCATINNEFAVVVIGYGGHIDSPESVHYEFFDKNLVKSYIERDPEPVRKDGGVCSVGSTIILAGGHHTPKSGGGVLGQPTLKFE